jgi:DNA-binding NarL/FixJ family response regulator
MTPIRVVLADDHSLVRAGIRALLQQIEGVSVVAEAGNSEEAWQAVQKHLPDIVLMDITMPGASGLEATSRIARENPKVRVVILSMHTEQEYILQAIRAGASGYLLKGAHVPELEMALSAVINGETYLSPAATKHVMAEVAENGSGPANSFEQLSPRQRQVLQLIAEGFSRKQIARQLNVSVKTVDTHRAQLMENLDIQDVAGLVRYAIRVGLVHDVPDYNSTQAAA